MLLESTPLIQVYWLHSPACRTHGKCEWARQTGKQEQGKARWNHKPEKFTLWQVLMVPALQREILGRKALWKRNESAIIAETKRLTVLVTGIPITRKIQRINGVRGGLTDSPFWKSGVKRCRNRFPLNAWLGVIIKMPLPQGSTPCHIAQYKRLSDGKAAGTNAVATG